MSPVLQKQSKDRFGLEGDEESTMLEESVSPKKYVVLHNIIANENLQSCCVELHNLCPVTAPGCVNVSANKEQPLVVELFPLLRCPS